MLKLLFPIMLTAALCSAATITIEVPDDQVQNTLKALKYLQGQPIQLAVASGDRAVLSYDCPTYRDPNDPNSIVDNAVFYISYLHD